MNKAMIEEDFKLEKNVPNTAADIDQGNYKVFLSNLDIDRTLRIYKSLLKLSSEAVEAVANGRHADFSSITDKMRPLMCYIADNNIKLSSFFDIDNPTTSEIVEREPNIKETVQGLLKNIKTIQSVNEAAGSMPFNSAFLASKELANAFIDFKLDLAWDYEHDPVILINLDDLRLIDYLVARGQKRFILAGGAIETKNCESVIKSNAELVKLPDHQPLKKQSGIPVFSGRPMHRFTIFDMGIKKISQQEIEEIILGVHNGRNDQWGKFNTINRGDTTRIINNLANMAIHEQTSSFHNTLKGHSAIIVCPGPSLEKNINLLKKVRGRALIICVLHALKDLQRIGIDPDIVIHVDPSDLKSIKTKKNGEVKSFWEQWITSNDMSKIGHFVVSNYSTPELFQVPADNVMWMSSGLPVGDLLPIDVFDYERVGGSVSHAAFDLAVELGCSSIVLVGQDLAFAEDGTHYSKHADYGETMVEKNKTKQRMKVYGDNVEADSWHGGKIISNNTFIAFRQAYEQFARELKENDLKFFNCTEGGLYIDGFKHCTLETFIDTELSDRLENAASDVLVEHKLSLEQNKPHKIKETKKFIGKNRVLASEIRDLIKILIPIAEKRYHSDDDLRKFDKLQGRMIKKMSKNKFYSLGLQRDIHILQAGLRADPTVKGQLGFHLDFLRVAQDLNKRFARQLSDQFNQIN